MKDVVRRTVVERMFSVRLYTPEEIEALKKQQQEMLDAQIAAHKQAELQAARQKELAERPVSRTQVKVGRNDPCPCGSGKKFKHCHGA